MGCGSSQIQHSSTDIHTGIDKPKMECVSTSTTSVSDKNDEHDEVDNRDDQVNEEEKLLMHHIKAQMPRLLALETVEEFYEKENSDEIDYLKNKIGINKDRKKRKIYYVELQKLGLVDLFLKIWKPLFCKNFTEKDMKKQRDLMRTSQLLLWNGTDISEEICHDVIQTQTHIFLLQCLQDDKLALSDFRNANILSLTKGIFGIFHNLLQMVNETRTALREQHGVKIISSYKDKGNTMLQSKALICLAYLIDDEENENLISNDKTFKFIVHILQNALENSNHRSKYGYSLEEIAKAINLLAANDQNKEKFTEKNLAESYGQILCGYFNTTEKFHAANGLWILAFNKKCKEVISTTKSCMNGLLEVQHEDDVELTRAIRGALWVIKGMDKKVDSHKQTASKKGHIMLSYNWSNQTVLLKVRDVLREAGYLVWMDVDQMSGNILQAMAEAIEKASVILVCFSHKYYESPNCRLEAEYAFQKKKPIIPLKMEYGYTPEGWLGILIGTSLYFDFARETKYKISIEGLLREIQSKDLGGQDVVAVKTSNISSIANGLAESGHQHGAIVKQNVYKCIQWSFKDVEEWLINIGLSKHIAKFSDFDGSLLLELHYMLKEAPESFYRTVREEMKFSLIEILKFTKEIKKL